MLIKIIFLLVAAVFVDAQGYATDITTGDPFVDSIMHGISNKGKTMNKPYVAAGDRTYIIGTQDGLFPDMGGHVHGEMAGLWLHPIKLMDGYWGKITDLNNSKEIWLMKADDFINYPYGNKHVYNKILKDFSVERFQFSPDGEMGMVVRYTLKNNTNENRKLKFTFAGKSDLSPVWLSKEMNVQNDEDVLIWNKEKKEIQANDISNNWFLSVSSNDVKANGIKEGVVIPQETIGKGKAFALESEIDIPANGSKTIEYIIAGSYKNKEEASSENANIKAHSSGLLNKKIAYYTKVITKAKIIIPDKRLQEVYSWVKINTHWLIRDVPEIGRGLGAGFMEYPWWFGCDNTYALQGAFAAGDPDLCLSTLRLLQKISEKNNGNGRIIHESSSNGIVYNSGNTQETAHFIMAVWKAYEWTGDDRFLADTYPFVKKSINWLMTDKDANGNLFPEGYGIMEVPGLNTELVDVAVYSPWNVSLKWLVDSKNIRRQKSTTKWRWHSKKKLRKIFGVRRNQ